MELDIINAYVHIPLIIKVTMCSSKGLASIPSLSDFGSGDNHGFFGLIARLVLLLVIIDFLKLVEANWRSIEKFLCIH